jgi:hypothetical protein
MIFSQAQVEGRLPGTTPAASIRSDGVQAVNAMPAMCSTLAPIASAGNRFDTSGLVVVADEIMLTEEHGKIGGKLEHYL